MSSVDAVIVGAGPNGLAAAIALAREGLEVLVVEAQEKPGGGLRSDALTLPGFTHDLCSAVHPLAVGSPFLSSLPLDRHGVEWIEPPIPLAHPLTEEGEAVALHRDPAETARGLGADGAAWLGLMRPLIQDWEGFSQDVLGPVLRWPPHPIRMAAFGLKAVRSASSLAGRRFGGREAQALFAGCAAHSFLPLDRAPSAAVGLVLAATAHAVGWPIPRGGAGALARAMVRYLESLGGEVVTGWKVDSLDELPSSRAVLLDLTPRQVMEVARGHLPERYLRRLGRYRYGPGVVKVDWALDGPVPWRAPQCTEASTIHLGGSLDEIEAAERAPWEDRVAERPFVLFSEPTRFDPTRAPEGKGVGWGYCHVPAGWRGNPEEVARRIEAQVERFAPGFRDGILARSVRGPAEMEQANSNLVGGDINGGLQDLRQVLARPVLSLDPYATPTPGLYLCSSSTPPGGGVHGMCGYHAARSALRKTFRG
ncbi:MAG: NAD(P)/FAD-dependent oxidoreductase [Gemmatimonadales bacterium]|nr:MAG: NAD(P)/FAD-dependent oxidoreductase [Gemmatimonadales bacterium]